MLSRLVRISAPPPLGRRAAMLTAPAFVLGAGLYMYLPAEPDRWVAAVGVLAALVIFVALRDVVWARWPAIWLLVATIGFAWGLAHAEWSAAPRLDREGAGSLTGKITWIETGAKRQRLTLDGATFETRGRTIPLERVRFTLRDASGLAIGDRVEARVVLRPPGAPVAPGAYDFRRDAYFRGLGGVGFAIGPVAVTSEAAGDGGWFASARVGFRAQIYAAMPDRPDLAGVIAALTVGDRSGVIDGDREALRASGLAHLLAISGLHLGMAATSVFLALRLLFALPHGFALRFPAHKVAAAAAILAAAVYLGISGAAPPAERAFVTVVAVMIAVMTDRLRSGLWFVAWAAIIVAAASPNVVVGPSFQLSFAAVIGIVAAFEAWVARPRDRDSRPLEAFGPVRPVLVYAGGILGASLIATLATAPLALAHFQQAPLFGVFANLIAMPAMAFVIMPSAIIAALLAPFDAAGPALVAMGLGVEFVLGVAHEVAGWPGGVIRMPAPPDWTAGAFLLGLALIAGLRGWPRVLGLIGPAAGLAGMLAAVPPDVLLGAEGRLASVRVNNTLYASTLRRGGFELEAWRRFVGASDAKAMDDGAEVGFRCDDRGCVIEIAGKRIAISRSPEGFPADCRAADLVIALHRAPRGRGLDCAGDVQVIDQGAASANGAHAIWIDARKGLRIETVGDQDGGRLWSR